MATGATTNKYLTGAYAPVPDEISSLDLEVVGDLPVELNGRYLRNGPNPLGPRDHATYHWFTGDAMVHGVRLRDGRADWYRSRYVRSTAVSAALDEDPAPGERHAGMDVVNTNVVGIGGRTFALVEAGARPVELTDELDTIEHSDLGGTLPNGYTAHPKVDPATGDLHAISYHWALPALQYTVIGQDGTVRHLTDIEVPDGPMVHDCSITGRWVVVYDLPVTFDLDGAMGGASFPYAWNPSHPARIGLVPLGGRGDQVRWFDIAPCYVFHPLNAHDDGDTVVLDVVRYDRMFDTKHLGPDDALPLLWRWTIDTTTGRVTEEQLSDQPLEFPRVDERLVGRAHRWGYGAEVARSEDGDENDFGGRLVRIDGKTGGTEVIDLGPGRRGGEWVMVPRHAQAAEDDGWLVSLVHDQSTDRSELVVLAAQEPSADPVARVLLPARVPVGFHGNWVPDPG
jgi:carotenoid cleavage dioxygenase-like enzyme